MRLDDIIADALGVGRKYIIERHRAIARAALEEAAKVAASHPEIAAAIRRLKGDKQ